MSKEDGYKIRNEQGIHFVTFAVVEWVVARQKLSEMMSGK